MLHNRVWRGLLSMNLKRNLTQIQNNSLHCHAWATLDCSTQRALWLRHETDTVMCHSERGSERHASFWLASFHDNHSEPHRSAPITVKQQEDWLYNQLIVNQKKEGEGGGGWRGPLTSLSISNCFLTLSVCSITPSFGKRRQRKTEKDERKTEI